jgi:hypothetical protein
MKASMASTLEVEREEGNGIAGVIYLQEGRRAVERSMLKEGRGWSVVLCLRVWVVGYK